MGIALCLTAGACNEFESNPRVTLVVENQSAERSLFVVQTRSGEPLEEAMQRAFNRIGPNRDTEVFLGGDRVEGDEPGGCLRSGERVWVLASPSGLDAPVSDPDTGQEVRSDLLRWVPDAAVWQEFDEADCFADDFVQMSWP